MEAWERQLREYAEDDPVIRGGHSPTARAAVAEIDRLRVENDRLRTENEKVKTLCDAARLMRQGGRVPEKDAALVDVLVGAGSVFVQGNSVEIRRPRNEVDLAPKEEG